MDTANKGLMPNIYKPLKWLNIKTNKQTNKQTCSDLRMGRRTEQTFFQRGNADDQQAHVKMLGIVNHRGNSNQNHNEILPHLWEWLSSKRTEINKCWQGCGKKVTQAGGRGVARVRTLFSKQDSKFWVWMVTVPMKASGRAQAWGGDSRQAAGAQRRAALVVHAAFHPRSLGPIAASPQLHTGPAQRPAPSLSTSPPTGSSSTRKKSSSSPSPPPPPPPPSCWVPRAEPRAAWDIPISASLKLHWNHRRGGGASPPPAAGPNTLLKGEKTKMCTARKLALSDTKTCLTPPWFKYSCPGSPEQNRTPRGTASYTKISSTVKLILVGNQGGLPRYGGSGSSRQEEGLEWTP